MSAEHDEGTSPAALMAWQAEVGALTSGSALQDALLSPKDAQARIQSLPIEDLHRAIRVIGLEDSSEILALASGEQVRGMLDAEIWVKDQLDLERVDPWLTALMRGGPEAMTDRLMALDDAVINWVVRRSIQVIAIEDPDSFDPPDTEYVVTPDNQMCVVFPDPGPRDLPVKVFLDVLMRTAPEYCYNLMVFSSAALDSVLQEDAYRWRSGRMADRGYVDYYDALPVYTAPRPDEITAARQALPRAEGPVGYWMRPVVAPDQRLTAAIERMDPEAQDLFHQGLAYVLNMALSADRVDPWDEAATEGVFQRIRAGLALGLDALAGPEADPKLDAERLAGDTPTFVFRTGYGRMQATARPVTRLVGRGDLRGPGGPTDGVDIEPLRSWAEALGGRHPMDPEGAPLGNPEALALAGGMAQAIAALAEVAPQATLDEDGLPTHGLGARALTHFTATLIGADPDQPLPLDRLAEAHRALFTDGQISDEIRDLAARWWAGRASDTEAPGAGAAALDMLLDAAAEEMGGLNPEELEPRFLRLWIC